MTVNFKEKNNFWRNTSNRTKRKQEKLGWLTTYADAKK